MLVNDETPAEQFINQIVMETIHLDLRRRENDDYVVVNITQAALRKVLLEVFLRSDTDEF